MARGERYPPTYCEMGESQPAPTTLLDQITICGATPCRTISTYERRQDHSGWRSLGEKSIGEPALVVSQRKTT
jgi:hypothetical protein